MQPHFQIQRTETGRLLLVLGDARHEGIVPIRNFPVTAPHQGISLVDSEGKERLWIDHLDTVPAPARQIIEDELCMRDFTPIISHIKAVNTFTTPSTWQIDTDRGPTELTLKGEEDIRRLGNGSLLITDSNGIQFLIVDALSLDKRSRRFLERFL